MLGGLVEGLDLGDEEQLVAASHRHAQDQLQEAGHVLHGERGAGGGDGGDGEAVPRDTVLAQIMPVKKLIRYYILE